ncbi:MAG: RNA 2',3'-cyclic phosphodiesterase [Armatimonadota bacterium]
MTSIRIFLAVILPDEIKSALANVSRELQVSGADVKWVKPENYHITMKFLGDVKPEMLNVIIGCVKTALKDTQSFSIKIHGAGAFMKHGVPGVIWAGIDQNSGQLGIISGRVDDLLSTLGFEKENRAFSAHITLGRARSAGGAEKLRDLLVSMKDISIGCMNVNSISIMKSDLKPDGPVYCILQTIEIG